MSERQLTALIVDDEPPARRKIRKFLERDAEIHVVGEAASGARAVAAVRSLSPDVVFLDIQMGRMDGFGVLEVLGTESLPQIVFVTAHDEYALRAFEVAAVDYLLKPFDAERFARALARVKQRARGAAGGGPDLEDKIRSLLAAVGRTTRILVKSRDRSVLLNACDIEWVRAAGNYVELHAAGGEYLLRETLEGMRRQLDPQTFLRVHRSYLVNAGYVREIRPESHGDHLIVMRDGAQIRLSRRYRAGLPAAIRRNL